MQSAKTLSVIVIIFLHACTTKKNEAYNAVTKNIPSSFYNADSVAVYTSHGIAYINTQPINGFVFAINAHKDTIFLEGFIHGKKEGICYAKYPNLQYQYFQHFVNGKMEGVQKSWWENGKQKQEAHYKNDVFHGTIQEWAFDGTMTRENTYADGHEDGKQRMWYDNGKLRANYVVKNGRIYGLSGTMNCYNAVEKKK